MTHQFMFDPYALALVLEVRETLDSSNFWSKAQSSIQNRMPPVVAIDVVFSSGHSFSGVLPLDSTLEDARAFAQHLLGEYQNLMEESANGN